MESFRISRPQALHTGTLAIITFALVFTILNLGRWKDHNTIIKDANNYYAYLPALVIHQDLHLNFTNNLPAAFPGTIWYETTPGGEHVIKVTCGMAILYAPFFMIAHLWSLLFGEANGYSPPYHLLINIGAVTYALIGVVVLKKMLDRFFSPLAASITLLGIFLGTNIFYYITMESGMTHSYNCMLLILLLWFTVKWHEDPNWRSTLGVGLTGGLLFLIRPSNGIFLFLPLLYGMQDRSSRHHKALLFQKHWSKVLMVIPLTFLVTLPQLIYWKEVTGQWLYYSYGEEGFCFSRPRIIDGLFSYRKGWLLYTPLMVLGVLGLPSLRRSFRALLPALLPLLILHIYIIFSWWCWWYGGGFGARAMIVTYALLAFPLAGFLDDLPRRYLLRPLFMILVVVLIGWNQRQIYQYRRAIIHWDSMTKKAYWSAFWDLSPSREYWKKYLKHPDYEEALHRCREHEEN